MTTLCNDCATTPAERQPVQPVLPRATRLLWTAWYSFFRASMFSLTQQDVLPPTITRMMVGRRRKKVNQLI